MTAYNDKKMLKTFFKLLYFGTFDSWCNNHNVENSNEPIKFIRKFKKELKKFVIFKVAKNGKKHIKDYNIKGSVCSNCLQEYESRISEAIYCF